MHFMRCSRERHVHRLRPFSLKKKIALMVAVLTNTNNRYVRNKTPTILDDAIQLPIDIKDCCALLGSSKMAYLQIPVFINDTARSLLL